jgi:phosphopantetheinyl transferase (holo-ACP synthase)
MSMTVNGGADGGETGGVARAPLGIGIDAEQVARFEKFAAGAAPWRLVYSEREARHLAAQPRVAVAFCAAFCCKEAFYKAFGAPLSFPHLECLYLDGGAEPRLVLTPALAERLGGRAPQVRVDDVYLEDRGELLVEVRLVNATAARRESVEVAAVAAARERIEGEDFSPAEVAALGGRRAQSLAGALALKRALVGVWAAAGVAAPCVPGDFELGHHPSGAPRLASAPAGLAPADVFVSIAHTRRWAYGLAAACR